MEPGPEGSPILLAERRTLSFPDRKIILGSTPLHEDTSNVLRSYAHPIARLRAPLSVLWGLLRTALGHIEWQPGQPGAAAAFRCPSCRALVPESAKPGMVARAGGERPGRISSGTPGFSGSTPW